MSTGCRGDFALVVDDTTSSPDRLVLLPWQTAVLDALGIKPAAVQSVLDRLG